MFFIDIPSKRIEKLIIALRDIDRAAMNDDVERDNPDKMQGHDKDCRNAEIEYNHTAWRTRHQKLLGERTVERQLKAAARYLPH